MNPVYSYLESVWFQPVILKCLKCNFLVSKSALQFNLYRYTEAKAAVAEEVERLRAEAAAAASVRAETEARLKAEAMAAGKYLYSVLPIK